jgi:serine/threonine protein kinase
VYEPQADENKRYALKELKHLFNKKCFEREIKIYGLDHPNIVKIFRWNIGGDFMPYYIMEYLVGGSLRQHIQESFCSDDRYVFESRWTINRIILATCNALAQAHSSNIYHRDLKPDNIMYTNATRYEVNVADWSLGKDINRESLALTAASGGEICGTPGYCSPIQWFALDQLVEGRTDIYFLGIIFYEMTTRMRPPVYDSTMTRQHVDPPSKYHPTISRLLYKKKKKMIDLNPENRQSGISTMNSKLCLRCTREALSTTTINDELTRFC